MTNIVTRKGLAFGALVALASTAIAGAPASAAGEVLLAPSEGTGYTVSTTDTFTLNASLASGQVASNIAQLKYKVVTDGSFIAKATVTSAGQTAFDVYTNATGIANSAANKGATGVGATNYVAANVQTAKVIAPVTGSNFPNPTSLNTIAVSVDSTSNATTATTGDAAATTTATKTVAVTAWIDSNNDGVVDSGEFQETRTVTFKKYSEITPTVALVAPNTGDASIAATVAWGDVNVDQVAGEGVNFGYSHGSTPTVVAVASGTGATYSSTTGKWTLTTAGTLASATTAYAQAKIGSTLLGSAVSGTVTARTITSVTANAVTGNDAIADASVTANASQTARVRTNGSWTASVKALDTATTPVAKAGAAVVATVATNATLSATAGSVVSVTVNGTTYTSGTTLAALSIPLTTDASGLATVALSSAGMTASNTVTVTFTAQNFSSDVVGDFEDAAFVVTEASSANGYITTPGATSVLNYTIKDQFGVAPASAFRVVAAVTGGSGSRTYYSATAVNGAATISVVDAQTTTTTAASVVATIEAQSSTTLNWASSGSSSVTTAIAYSTSALGFTTAPVINATTGINNGTWTTAGDQKQTITQAKQLSATTVAADGTVAPAASTTWAQVDFQAIHQYSTVKVSGAGVYLAVASGTPAADTLTFQAGASLQSVFVASNTVGTKTLTFVIGDVTKTVDVKFASAATTVAATASATSAEATATTFAVAVPASAQAGRSIDATVTVTDKWGNPVAGFEATATVSGVALVNGSATANVTTDANGKATVKLSAGVNDLGDAVVTFSDNDNNTGSTNQLVDLTAVAKTVVFGSSDGYIDVLNGKRASVSWSFAKGKRVAVYLDGVRRYNIIQPGDSELNLQFNMKKGSHSIKLVIGGVIVDTISVKVSK
jgi:trimeric autotransporter adhesin